MGKWLLQCHIHHLYLNRLNITQYSIQTSGNPTRKYSILPCFLMQTHKTCYKLWFKAHKAHSLTHRCYINKCRTYNLQVLSLVHKLTINTTRTSHSNPLNIGMGNKISCHQVTTITNSITNNPYVTITNRYQAFV